MKHKQAEQAPVAPLKYCLYSRKSTEAEDKQALSIESQVKEMQALAERDHLHIVEIKREAHSSKEVGQRPIYNEMLSEIKQGKFNAILTWAPDRLSRNAGDLGSVVDLMDQGKLIEIKTYGQKFTNNPNEKFLLMILGSQAKLENDNKAVNVKRGLRTRCEMGWRPGVAPTGYLNEKHVDKKCQCRIDPRRAPVIKQMFEKVASEQWSGRKVYRWLREINFKTHRGKPLVLANIYIILRNPFYYGDFEYPVNGGQWYTGKHTPIIDKILYDKVQMTLNQNYIPKTESKEFAFTKLIHCGYCGSGISADEKFKKLKDGGTNRHVYYFCTKARNIDCKNPAINEPNLITELIEVMDKVDLDELGIKSRIEDEISRFNKFRTGVLGHKQEKMSLDIDVRNYTKYLLRDGTLMEKRELLSCMKSKLILREKKVCFI
ncbi:MAG: Recombinase [Candidatus Nomurabacteria bacterium GW2011_GWA1_36_15]|uniref:Recombinase n=1 Tax=Candidatus Nomurabacteria bacterium GW2011_GWA1_36_15 TaxID=1618728 RepID=A0A0G0H180_9BACT|nr:MAG: Recombinase [Candidatus Nomurabacteria bacterium GW2011_GWA1_36_15]